MLYSCATSRGVVLVLVRSLSSTTFLLSLILSLVIFINLISDNGTNFTAEKTQNYTCQLKNKLAL